MRLSGPPRALSPGVIRRAVSRARDPCSPRGGHTRKANTMKSLVGNKKVPHQSFLRYVANVRKLQERLATFGVNLTAEERKRTSKMRTGGAEIARKIMDLADAKGIKLPIPTSAVR